MTAHAQSQVLAEIWREVLDADVAVDDDVFALGATSIDVVKFITLARGRGFDIELNSVLKFPAPADLMNHLDDAAVIDGKFDVGAYLLGLREERPEQEPLVMRTPAAAGRLPLGYVLHTPFVSEWVRSEGVELLGDRLALGLELDGMATPAYPRFSIHEIAQRISKRLYRGDDDGYVLVGECLGGMVALEMARRWQHRTGRSLPLVLVGPTNCGSSLDPGWGVQQIYDFDISILGQRFGLRPDLSNLAEVLPAMRRVGWYSNDMKVADFPRLQVLSAASAFAYEHYQPEPYDGEVHVFMCRDNVPAVQQFWSQRLTNATYYSYGHPSILGMKNDPQFRADFGAAVSRADGESSAPHGGRRG